MKLIRCVFCYLLIAICQLLALAQSPQPCGTDYTATSITFPLSNPPQQIDEGRVSVQLLDNPGVGVYCYWIVSNFTIGNSSPAGPVCVSNGPNTLVNGIRVSWSGINGAASYDVLRTSNQIQPAGACGCAVATGVTTLTATDTSVGAYTVNTFVPNIGTFVLTNEPQSAGVSNLAFRVNGSKVLSLPSNAVATFASAFTPVSHQFLTGMSAGGIFSAAQPASADISDGTGSGVVARQTNAALASPTTTGTDNGVETLGSKTLTSPTISGTVAGGASYTGPTLTGPTITGTVAGGASYTGPTITGPTITGTVAGGASYTGPTITGPTITGTVAGGGTYSSPVLASPQITGALVSGSGYATASVATCNTGAGVGAACNNTLTWSSTLSSATYRMLCELDSPNTSGGIGNTSSKTTTGALVATVDFTAGTAVSTGTVRCIALP